MPAAHGGGAEAARRLRAPRTARVSAAGPAPSAGRRGEEGCLAPRTGVTRVLQLALWLGAQRVGAAAGRWNRERNSGGEGLQRGEPGVRVGRRVALTQWPATATAVAAYRSQVLSRWGRTHRYHKRGLREKASDAIPIPVRGRGV